MEKPLVIFGELYSMKNSKQIFFKGNTPFITSSNACKKNRSELCFKLRSVKAKFNEMVKFKQFPFKIKFKIYRKTKRKFDYINIVQQLCDCMVEVGYLPDDDADHLIPVFAEYEVDKINPRVEMEVI